MAVINLEQDRTRSCRWSKQHSVWTFFMFLVQWQADPW